MQLNFLNFEKKNIDMAQNSTQITELHFQNLKQRKSN